MVSLEQASRTVPFPPSHRKYSTLSKVAIRSCEWTVRHRIDAPHTNIAWAKLHNSTANCRDNASIVNRCRGAPSQKTPTVSPMNLQRGRQLFPSIPSHGGILLCKESFNSAKNHSTYLHNTLVREHWSTQGTRTPSERWRALIGFKQSAELT